MLTDVSKVMQHINDNIRSFVLVWRDTKTGAVTQVAVPQDGDAIAGRIEFVANTMHIEVEVAKLRAWLRSVGKSHKQFVEMLRKDPNVTVYNLGKSKHIRIGRGVMPKYPPKYCTAFAVRNFNDYVNMPQGNEQ